MKTKIITFLNSLGTYDYILFGAVFAVFILLIILSLLLRHKTALAMFLILFSFLFLFIAPVVGYIQMHKYIFKHSLELVSQKKLNFTKAVVVKGVLKNESKHNFKECKITASLHKHTKNKYKNYIYALKAFQKMSILENNIVKGEAREFKIIVEPFTYKKDYNVSLDSRCR